MSKRSKGKNEPAAPAKVPDAAAKGDAPSSDALTGPVASAPALTPVGFDYRKLALASPQTEFESYARQKIKTAERLGQKDEVEVMLEAFELGKSLLERKPEGQS